MTNEELKQKIVKVLKETINWTTDYSIPIGIVYKSELDEIADALIAAGISDTKAAVIEFAGVLRDKISREHSLGTKGYIVGFKEMKERALADVDALVKEVCGDEPNDDRLC